MSTFLVTVVISLIVGLVGMFIGGLSAYLADDGNIITSIIWGFIIGFSIVWVGAGLLTALLWADDK